MKTLMGNNSASVTNIYNDGYLVVEHENYFVACNQKQIKLPRTQFLILSRLVLTPDRFVSSKEIWQHVWGQKKPFNAISLHVYIYNLRQKLKPFDINIETWVNIGYRFVPYQAVEKAKINSM
jgi:two-component system, OmpR family, alkaline phosphatase synthesis response regulator PhoP